MLSIPSTLHAQFDEQLLEKAIPIKTQWSYIKWLRYYLDFCRKYNFHESNRKNLPFFLKKLEEKRQTKAQLKQAKDAIELYYGIIGEKRHTKKTSNAYWQAEYARLANEIQVRHYSPKTLKAYRGWTQKFQSFTKSKSPELISTEDVKEYLSFLAVERNVSASTHNQAFNALFANPSC